MAIACGAQAQPEDLAQLVEILADVGLFLTSADGTILSFNPGAEAITGVTAAAALGQPLARVCAQHAADASQRSATGDSPDPADAPDLADLADLAAVARRGKAGLELQLVRADASLAWVKARVYPAAQGRFAVQLTDITACKQAEVESAALFEAQQQAEAARRRITEQKRVADDVREMNVALELRVAERTLQMQRFMELIEASTDFVAMGRPDLRPFYLNRAFREALGLSAATDISTFKIGDFHAPASMARIASEAIPAVLRDGSWLGESELRRADGSIIPVSQLILGHFDESGRVEHFSTIMRNETHRRKIEAELRASQERLLLATEAAQVGIWDWNIVDHVLSCDAVMYRLYGLTPEQFTGDYVAWLAGIHPEDRAAAEEQVRLALQQGREYSAQFRVLWPDQTVRIICARGVIHRDEADRPVRMVGTNWDITEMKQSEQAIRALNEKLQRRTTEVEEANRELEAFSYSVSHDLRAPLRAIDGFSRIALEEYGGRLPAEAQDYLRDILAQTKRMGQLVDDLLAFAKLNRQPLQKRTVAVDRLVSQCLAELQPRPPTESRPQLSVAALPPCSADPALLKQVFLNLIDNALKYSQVRQPAVIEIGATPQAGETVYFIKDNGVGFDMRYADKLFGVFQRLHRQEEYEGTGVGLAIVQRVIHRHGGRVWAEAKINHGATFYFSLPVG